MQAAIFGEVLHLHRRIESDLGGDEIRIIDRVVNTGFSLTPHMLFYDANGGLSRDRRGYALSRADH